MEGEPMEGKPKHHMCDSDGASSSPRIQQGLWTGRSRWVRQRCNMDSSDAKAQMKASIFQGLAFTLPSLAKDLAHSRQGCVLTGLHNLAVRWGKNSWGYLCWTDWEIRRNAFFGQGVKFPPGGWELLDSSVWWVTCNLVEKVITRLVTKQFARTFIHSFIHPFIKDP